MSRGKYSPYYKTEFVPDHWETGTGGTMEVDINGFDYYGYNANGRDIAGLTENDYLFMTDDEFEDHLWSGGVPKLTAERKLEAIRLKLTDIAARKVWTHGECAIVSQELLDEFFRDGDA
jgi:hypothetical protein